MPPLPDPNAKPSEWQANIRYTYDYIRDKTVASSVLSGKKTDLPKLMSIHDVMKITQDNTQTPAQDVQKNALRLSVVSRKFLNAQRLTGGNIEWCPGYDFFIAETLVNIMNRCKEICERKQGKHATFEYDEAGQKKTLPDSGDLPSEMTHLSIC